MPPPRATMRRWRSAASARRDVGRLKRDDLPLPRPLHPDARDLQRDVLLAVASRVVAPIVDDCHVAVDAHALDLVLEIGERIGEVLHPLVLASHTPGAVSER